MRELTPEQRRAVERRDGSLLVRAGAGTGKTTVLVERFVLAVTEDEVGVESILAITFTEKAAAEMRTRVRRRFLDLGRREEARASESAWISTIHGFCSRVLRAHALSAGIDPDFRVLDELESERLAADAFDGALEEFMGDGSEPDRIEMVAAYRPDPLRDMVRTAYSHLRSRGERHPRLDETLPPRPAGEHERLEDAARTALAELAVAATSTTVAKAIDCIEARATLKGGNAKVLATAACQEYREAFEAHRTFEVAEREHRDHTMLRALLELYGDRYERLKRERSALDFEDLELITRDLLSAHEGLREAYSSRFEHVLVDEFQDTNELQNELLELLARDNLFRVGDENQSIYRFRHADVGVFRRHWESARGRGTGREHHGQLPLARGGARRDRPGVRAHLGRALRAAARGARVRASPSRARRRAWTCWWSTGAGNAGRSCWSASPMRSASRCTARPPGGRPRRGCWRSGWTSSPGRGRWSYGDVVMLFRATTAMGLFERALEERGIPVHVVGGRGYWGQQQVMDLRHWLAALANPLDGLAVYSVLASPLAGLSLDGVALIGLRARRAGRDPWWALSAALGRDGASPTPSCSSSCPPATARRLAAFADRFEAERRIAGQVSLETLIDRAVTLTGYDRHLLALPGRHAPDGERPKADADGARVRGGRGAQPARLHRRARGARRDPDARGRGAARGRGRSTRCG